MLEDVGIRETKSEDKQMCLKSWAKPVASTSYDGEQNNTSCPLHACVHNALIHYPSFS